MSMLKQLIENYQILCEYCDSFFDQVFTSYSSSMQCRQYCCDCCELESVTVLEAHVIREYVKKHKLRFPIFNTEHCIFLNDCSCRIYPARPIICRSHGLLLYDSEEEQLSRSCDLNFTTIDPETFDVQFALDTTMITENLMRLNFAYCHITGQDPEEVSRVCLETLV